MYSDYNSLLETEKEHFRSKFEKMWTQREKDFGYSFNFSIREQEIKAMRNVYGYSDEKINFAWESFFITYLDQFKNCKNINLFVRQFTDAEECKAIVRAAEDQIRMIEAEDTEEYWIIWSEHRLAAFLKFEDAAAFLNDFSKELIKTNHVDYLVKISLFQGQLTQTQIDKLLAKNQNNNVRHIAEHCWNWS